MGSTDPLSARVLKKLESQLSNVLAATSAIPPGGPNDVDELLTSYSIWYVDEDGIKDGGDRIENFASFTSNWHHEIGRTRTGGSGDPRSVRTLGSITSQAKAYPDETWEIVAFTEDIPGTELAREIRNAAYWVDQHAAGDFLLRLLILPSRYMHCFWLDWANEDGIVIIDAPSGTGFEYQRIYSKDEFLTNLRRSRAPAGIPPEGRR